MRPLIAVPATALLVVRAYTRRSLTPLGIVTATLTATVHALHPSPVPFTLLCTFFLLGTAATKVKHDIKATLTLSSSGSSGGEGPRTSTQVIANSGCASLLCIYYVYRFRVGTSLSCFGGNEDKISDIILLGIICNYVSVAADTLSSELGILSKSKPVLITTLRTVPPGTNGGVTLAGLLAGMGGSAVIAATSMLLLPFCTTPADVISTAKASFTSPAPSSPNFSLMSNKILLFFALAVWGTLGSVFDSLLGALLQASVVDRHTGKIVEGAGGIKVLTHSRSSSSSSAAQKAPNPEIQGRTKPASSKKPVLIPAGGTSRFINSGRDLLDNNEINLMMAASMTVWGMSIGALVWGLNFNEIF